MKRLIMVFLSVLVLVGCSNSDGLSGSYEVSKNDKNDPQAIFTFEEDQVIIDAMSEDPTLQLRESYEILEEEREDGLVLIEFDKGDFYNTGLNVSDKKWLYNPDEQTLIDVWSEDGKDIPTSESEENIESTILYLETN